MSDLEIEVYIDKQGGVIPQTNPELKRAQAADYGTLPRNIEGTNCGNCEYFNSNIGKGSDVGYCRHENISFFVGARNCCIFWDSPKYLRPTKSKG